MSRKRKLPFLKYKKPAFIAKSYIVKTETIQIQEKPTTGFEFAQYRKKPPLPEVKVTKYKYSKQDWRFYKSDEFLDSFEWRKLRLQALMLHGRKCQCCGATPETGAVMNVDHIKPRKTHPELALEINNLQVLCHECNHGKGNWLVADFR